MYGNNYVSEQANGTGNRLLIREYLTRTRAPPAIFKPTPITSYNPLEAPQQHLVNMAYKHPQLLIDDSEENDLNANDGNLLNGMVEKDIVSPDDIKMTESKSAFKINLFNNGSYLNNETSNTCKLIGNVKPNLVKTWEQLNATNNGDDDTIRMNCPINYNRQNINARNGFENQLVYPTNAHLFMGGGDGASPSAIETNNESFIISRAASKSDHFYDSIDNESFVTQDDDEQLASLCDDEHGGEGMAEYLSLVEEKEKLCWSVDSCN